MGWHKYTKEMVEYIRSIAEGRYVSEIHKMFNEHFGTDFTEEQVRSLKKENRIRSGVRGSNSTGGQFVKGHKPHCHVPVGTVSLRHEHPTTPIWWIKIAEPNKWQMLHQYLWEKKNGKVPEGKCLFFLDNDSTNYDLDNIVCIERRVLLILNHCGRITNDADANRCIIAEAELSRKMYDLGARGLNKYKESKR